MIGSAIPSRTKLLTACVIAGVYGAPALAQDDAPEIEEVVVTGSFIRGTPLDAPSPVQIVDRDSIEAQGAAVIWDVIKNLEVNSGSFADNGSGEVYGTAGTAQVNLRNLGENSTLTLINGKRMVPSGATTRSGGEFVDINSIPLVMTERLEVLTDGGSALYGADAVAGVVNVIMRTEFEGFELYSDIQKVEDANDAYDATVSAIWGWTSADQNTHFVISGERMEKDPIPLTAAGFYNPQTMLLTGPVSTTSSFFASGFFGAQLNRDYVNQEVIDLNQAEGRRSTVYTDPLCTSGLTDASGNPFFVAGLDPRQRGRPGRRSSSCVVDETQWRMVQYDQTRNSVAASFDHTFENGTEVYSFLQWSEQDTIRAGSGYRQSFGSFLMPSQGAYREGSRGQAFELGHFAPLFGMEQPVITNNPVDAINGGPNVVFRSGGRYNILRTGGDEDTTRTDTATVQLGMRGDFELGDRTLEWDVSYSGGYSSVETQRRDFIRDRLNLAGMGLGGPNCQPNGVRDFDFRHNQEMGPNGWSPWYDGYYRYVFEGYFVQLHETMSLGLTSNNQGQGDCMFYNSLLTQFTDPRLANSDELMDWLTTIHSMKDKRNNLQVLDALVTGDLFEMRGGTAAFAAGAQYRQRSADSQAAAINIPGIQDAILAFDANGMPSEYGYVSNNMGGSSNSLAYELSRNVSAVYGELSLPFWENVESQVALRWEDYGGNIGAEVSPKVALSWRPVETLLLRTSWSQSFRAPNPGIIGAGLDASSVSFLDPLDNQMVRAGLLPPTNENASLESSYTLGGPAPNVGNEYADTYSAGFIWTPDGALDGVSVQFDFWRFEVEDRVLPENASSAIKRQVAAFSEAAASPSNYVLNSSLDTSSGEELYAPCNPAALESRFGRDSDERLNCVVDPRLYQVAGVEESIPSPNRNLIQLKLGAINAGEITADGVDVTLGYRWDTDIGTFNSRLNYTFVRQYLLNNVPGLDNGLLDIGVYDAAGTTGDGNLVRSLPDHKGSMTFNWRNGAHGANLINRFVGSYWDLTYDLRIDEVNPFVSALMSRDIASYYDRWDAQYSYTHPWDNSDWGITRFTFGILDLLDADVPVRETGSLDYDAQVHDGRGRRLYARVNWSF